MQFDIIKGNIINAGTAAIILPSNPSLVEGAGSSTAIFVAAGRKKLTKACKEALKANGGNCEVGSAIPTLAFDLKSRGTDYIIHAIVPNWIDGEHQEYDNLCFTYLSSLKVAELMGCTSVAFPLLAAGNNGFDNNLALEIAIRSFRDYESSTLQKIILIIHSETVAALVRERGYNYVVEIPSHIALDKKDLHEQQRDHALFRNMLLRKAGTAVQAAFDSAMEFLRDPEIQKMMFEKAKEIVMDAMKKEEEGEA